MIISVCPPHAALDVAWAVHGFSGLYVDANAISPGTAREVAQMITESGGRYVDGGIIGRPPRARRHRPAVPVRRATPGRWRGAVRRDARWTPGWSPARSPPPPRSRWPTRAGPRAAPPCCWPARALAHAQGVEDALLAEWELSQPQLPGAVAAARPGRRSAKGWRWVAEMEEIAATMAAAGLPDGFHQAAAEIFRRSPRDSQAAGAELDRVLKALSGG